MPVADSGFEPMLAGHANCYRISTISSQYLPLDHSCKASHPGVSKREQYCSPGFEMLLLIRLGRFCALMNSRKVAPSCSCGGEADEKKPRQDRSSDRE
jgi:hypothetical protein